MESDGHRLYSVRTRTEIHEKMMKEIVQISEVFSLSQSDATVILIHLGWNSFKASDLLGDDKEKFLSELGLQVQVSDSNQNESCTDHDVDNLVSTPFCSHKLCTDCWTDYLSETLEKDEKILISCFRQDCVASVGPDTIEKLDQTVKEMYERYVLGSFMESNKQSIKWCPVPGCDYAIERHDDDESNDLGVLCLCGHTFCWSCQLESHRPVTCNNASLWCNELLDKSRKLVWFSKKTKRCPSCQIPWPNTELRYINCICRFTFCWRCLRSEEDHYGIWNCKAVSGPTPSKESALMNHLTLWEESYAEMEISKTDLKATERIIPKICGLGELDIRAVREAWLLIVQCRLVLKWSCVFGYFLTDYHIAKKQYLDHLREEATSNLVKHKETLDEVMNGAISGGDTSISFRLKLETLTRTTGNYFHIFVKTLEDGLCDVKVDAYEDVITDYWFCDRCTFQNDCLDYKCRMCVVPFEPTSAQKQQVSNVSSNPFPRQGGTNPLQSRPVAFGNSSSSSASAQHQQGPNMPNNSLARQGATDPWFD